MSSFYVTLPSNSSMNYYPNNTLANYVTKLPHSFDLPGEWEVGLSEIQFPISWYNVTDRESHMFLLLLDSDVPELVDVSPPPGHYERPDQLVKQINDALLAAENNLATRFAYDEKIVRVTPGQNHPENHSRGTSNDVESVRFSYNPISKRISADFKDRNQIVTVQMSKDLCQLLGFDWQSAEEYAAKLRSIEDDESIDDLSKSDVKQKARKFTENGNGLVELLPGKSSYTAERVCDLQRGFYSLFVYCDVVEPTVVGDFKVPLLRTVNIDGREGLIVSRIYQNIQYVPLHRKQFDTIEIDIRDDVGRKVPFERGKVIVTLHFRLRKPAYF